MLPKSIKKYLELLPKDKTNQEVIKNIEDFSSLYGSDYVNAIIWTQIEAKEALNQIGIEEDKTFYKFYLHSSEELDSYRENIYGLSQIVEDYEESFWEDRYPQIGERYLQMSSIEGEWSYFYDKETDAVYGVDWNEMDDFVAGKLKPLFTSFYDFLEWYYSEDEE